MELVRTCPSMRHLLTELDYTQGMLLEIVWRKYWLGFKPLPYYEDSRILTVRFEDVMADHLAQLTKICAHYELNDQLANKILKRGNKVFQTPTEHIRDTSSAQYVRFFNDEINDFFERQFFELPEKLGY